MNDSARSGLPGTVFLVGAGPGAPDLLTLRAARLLAEADIVFYDALVHPDTIALAAQARCVAVGKRCGRHSSAQAFINHSLIEAARRHRCVVRLKGGDPLVFGRAQEEMDALRAAGIRLEVVPGVTAALAAAADLGISLTRRGRSRSLALVTSRVGDVTGESRWLDCARSADTVAIYMARNDAIPVAQALMQAGRSADTPVVVVVNASLAEGGVQYGGRLGAIGEYLPRDQEGPALILLGPVLEEWVQEHASGQQRPQSAKDETG